MASILVYVTVPGIPAIPSSEEPELMPRWRRRDLITAGIAAPVLFATRGAIAAEAEFPARNIQFFVPYAPGGGFDVYVRVIAPVMEELLPHRVNIVPVNIAGGGGSKGTAQLY